MRLQRTAILLILLSICETIFAQGVVSERDAVSVAIAVASNQRNNGVVEVVKKMTSANNQPILYEVIMADSNVVLLSGNKACTPLLGEYKFCGISIVDDFEMIPCGLKCLVKNYVNQINQCYESEIPLNDDPQWNLIVNREDTSFRARSSVAPLLNSKWGQNESNDRLDNTAYNDFAPDSGCTYGSTHCPAGCVAVAMGQIMYYWSYPFFITRDNDIFNWCNMSDELRMNNSCYESNKKAINSLLEACGKSVNMSYHCSGSGSDLLLARDALREVFNYKASVTSFSYIDPGFSVAEMSNRIVDELDEGRPVLMRAVDPYYGGHAFICDGYNRNGKAHINWGWLGDFDGYYIIDNLNPDIYSLTMQLGIVYKIKPDVLYNNQGIVNLDLFYSNFLTNSYSPYRLVPEQSDSLFSASTNSPSAWRTIPEDATSIYQAHNEIILQPGFTAEWGSDFTARIEPCALCEEEMLEMEVRVGEEFLGIDSTITQRILQRGDTTILVQPSRLRLHPNPASHTLTVTTPEEVRDIQVYDLSGRAVFRWFVALRTETESVLDVGDIPVGSYILHVTTADGKTHIGRFVKN